MIIIFFDRQTRIYIDKERKEHNKVHTMYTISPKHVGKKEQEKEKQNNLPLLTSSSTNLQSLSLT